MGLFLQMGEDEPLPVAVQHVLAARRGAYHAAPPLAGLQQEVHLGIVAQRLIVAHALHRSGDGLFIKDAARAEGNRQVEPLLDHRLQHFQLHLAHELHMEFPEPLVPHQMELGVFLFQLPETAQRRMGVAALRQTHLVGQHRGEDRRLVVLFCAQSLTRPGVAQTRNGAHRPRRRFLHRAEFRARVDADLVHLLPPALLFGAAGEDVLYFQRAARHL